jgi:hypothetical protein
MRGKIIDLTGKLFGNLKVIGRAGTRASGEALWTCACGGCRNVVNITTQQVKRGHCAECGKRCRSIKAGAMSWERVQRRGRSLKKTDGQG